MRILSIDSDFTRTMIYCKRILVDNDGLGGVVGVDDNLHALLVGCTWST
jgi:hypothetical protein